MSSTPKWYETHLEEYRGIAFVKGLEEYERIYRRSLEAPEDFWAEKAREFLSWDREWDKVMDHDLEAGRIEWFKGGILNASYNCIDRHLDRLRNKVAFYWEGDNPREDAVITYGELSRRVNKFAAALKKHGVVKGDRVIIYLPMIVELPVAMLACARIGAVHSVVFGGFSAESIAGRIKDSGAETVITADGGYRAGKVVPLKENVDQALAQCPGVKRVIVFNRCDKNPKLQEGREFWWHDLLADPDLPDYIQPEPMEAEDPLFILYTSGSTGKPKGVVHTTGGYLLYVTMTTRYTFDLKDHETFWCTADIGWVTGHSYIVYGPLGAGLTGIIFEGVPTYPGFDRFWQVVAKYKVDKFYTAPTAIRSLAKEGDGPGAKARHQQPQAPGYGGRAHQPRGLALVLQPGGPQLGPHRGHLVADRDRGPHDDPPARGGPHQAGQLLAPLFRGGAGHPGPGHRQGGLLPQPGGGPVHQAALAGHGQNPIRRSRAVHRDLSLPGAGDVLYRRRGQDG